MGIQRSVLLIADIGGYTKFMSNHRIALTHAQEMIAALLETVIDAARGLEVAKLEGDAAFLYAPFKDSTISKLDEQVTEIRRAFLAKREEISVNRLCSCHGCTEVEKLTLKFVVHVGDVSFQKVKRYTELAGVDVILVHRMLKNDVPAREYVLMTDPVVQGFTGKATTLMHDFEGLGPTQTHFVNFDGVVLEVPAPKKKSFIRRLFDLMLMNAKGVPYHLRLKEACPNFHNVTKELGS